MSRVTSRHLIRPHSSLRERRARLEKTLKRVDAIPALLLLPSFVRYRRYLQDKLDALNRSTNDEPHNSPPF